MVYVCFFVVVVVAFFDICYFHFLSLVLKSNVWTGFFWANDGAAPQMIKISASKNVS